ncbi:hypothetical protein DL93DRAFT_275509 [Clavulina sp. PMI_390]|nr:hypothetical protein DL93DRAFT_275509 [Clavulina sp. PMI_390]
MVLGGVALLLNPSRPMADPKAAAADPLGGKQSTNPVDPEIAASIKRSLEADAPKVAKVAEESSPSSGPTSDTSSVKGSLHQAIIADSPIDARNAEAMSAPNGVQDGIKQAMNSDIPNMAKKQEEKSSTDAGASLQQALKADIPKAAKKAEEGVSA